MHYGQVERDKNMSFQLYTMSFLILMHSSCLAWKGGRDMQDMYLIA